MSVCAICGNGLQRNALEKQECTVLADAMSRHGNNIDHASTDLGVSLSTLKRKLLKHGLREKGKVMPGGRRGGHPCRHTEVAVTAGNEIEPS